MGGVPEPADGRGATAEGARAVEPCAADGDGFVDDWSHRRELQWFADFSDMWF